MSGFFYFEIKIGMDTDKNDLFHFRVLIYFRGGK